MGTHKPRPSLSIELVAASFLAIGPPVNMGPGSALALGDAEGSLVRDDGGGPPIQDVREPEGYESAFSRRDLRPSDASVLLPRKDRGRRECRVLAATHGPPAAKKAGGSHHRSSRIIRHSLRDGLRLIRDLPGVHDLLVTVACEIITSPTWHQPRGARTTRLRRPHQRRSSARKPCAPPLRPSHPAFNVRDDREAPLM